MSTLLGPLQAKCTNPDMPAGVRGLLATREDGLHRKTARAAVLTNCSMHIAGHINFNDEVSAALRLADGMLLVVDAAEGVMVVTEKAIKQAIMEGLPICLLISKVQDSPIQAYQSMGSQCCVVTACISSLHPHVSSVCSDGSLWLGRWTGSSQSSSCLLQMPTTSCGTQSRRSMP